MNTTRTSSALIAAYADAVNAELKDLKEAGCDVVQIDEPYLQAKPEKAKKYGVEGINRALAGVPAPTIVHMCFGYAYAVKEKPSGYSFLPELDRCCSNQVSLEARPTAARYPGADRPAVQDDHAWRS